MEESMPCRAACSAGCLLTSQVDPREYARTSARLLYPHVCVDVEPPDSTLAC